MMNSIMPIFNKVLYMSVLGTVIGLVVIILGKILDKKISPKWKCIIWVIVVISLIVPIKIEIKNENIKTLNIIEHIEKVQEKLYIEDFNTYNDEIIVVNQNNANEQTIIYEVASYLWITGVLGYLMLLILGNINIKRNIKNINCNDEKVNKILEICKETFNIKKNVKLILQEYKRTVSIKDVIRPKILITEEFLKQDDETIKYTLMHELAHYKRGDNLINYILLFVTIIHWFNPFVWVIFKKIRQDIELATDELVIKHIGHNERKKYGETLLKALSVFQEEKYTTKLLYISNNSKNMERRLKMMKLTEKFKKNQLIIAIISILIIVFLICTFFVVRIVHNDNKITETGNNNYEENKNVELNNNEIEVNNTENNNIVNSNNSNISNNTSNGNTNKVENNNNNNIIDIGDEPENFFETVKPKDEIVDDRIIIVTTAERANINKEYALDEFSEVELISIEPISYHSSGDTLTLHLKKPSVDNVLKGIELLKKSPIIRIAEPSYVIYID